MHLYKETETVEFKKSTGELKEGIISIVAMLNKHNRGELYFGVRNDGVVVGQDITDKTLRDISQAISNHIEPELRPSWDSSPSDKCIDDIDEAELVRFIEKSNANGRMDYSYVSIEDVLTRLDLIKEGRITNTARIMFCRNSGLEMQMAIFATNERLTFNDIKHESGTVTELVSVAEKYIKNNIKWRVELNGSIERKEIPEVPVDAVREALVNSFCHRDYRMSQNNEVSIYKNRIEIYNPGTFPHGLTPQDFIEGSERSVKRNPQLAQMLYYSKEVESFGTGLRRITVACKNAGVKVEFQMLKTGFVVVFYRAE